MEVSEEECSWRVDLHVNCQEFRQADRNGRIEAAVAQRSEFLYCIRESMGSQWREARWGETWSILGNLRTRRKRCFEHFVVCL